MKLSNEQLSIVSDNAADVGQQVTLVGSATEAVALNGETAVRSANTYATMISATLSAPAAGNVTVTGATSGKVVIQFRPCETVRPADVIYQGVVPIQRPPQELEGGPGWNFEAPDLTDYTWTERFTAESTTQPIPFGTPHPTNSRMLLIGQKFTETQDNKRAWVRVYGERVLASDQTDHGYTISYPEASKTNPTVEWTLKIAKDDYAGMAFSQSCLVPGYETLALIGENFKVDGTGVFGTLTLTYDSLPGVPLQGREVMSSNRGLLHFIAGSPKTTKKQVISPTDANGNLVSPQLDFKTVEASIQPINAKKSMLTTTEVDEFVTLYSSAVDPEAHGAQTTTVETVVESNSGLPPIAPIPTGTAAFGSITFKAQPTDGQTLTINDQVNPAVVFEFDSNGHVTAGHIAVTIGAAFPVTGVNLASAINSQASALKLNVTTPLAMLPAEYDGIQGDSITLNGNFSVPLVAAQVGSFGPPAAQGGSIANAVTQIAANSGLVQQIGTAGNLITLTTTAGAAIIALSGANLKGGSFGTNYGQLGLTATTGSKATGTINLDATIPVGATLVINDPTRATPITFEFVNGSPVTTQGNVPVDMWVAGITGGGLPTILANCINGVTNSALVNVTASGASTIPPSVPGYGTGAGIVTVTYFQPTAAGNLVTLTSNNSEPPASGTLAVQVLPNSGDTVKVGSQTFEFMLDLTGILNGTVLANGNIQVSFTTGILAGHSDQTTPNGLALHLAGAINANSPDVTAAVVGTSGVVTVTAKVGGVAGNSLVLWTSNISVTVSGSGTLTGAAAAPTITCTPALTGGSDPLLMANVLEIRNEDTDGTHAIQTVKTLAPEQSWPILTTRRMDKEMNVEITESRQVIPAGTAPVATTLLYGNPMTKTVPVPLTAPTGFQVIDETPIDQYKAWQIITQTPQPAADGSAVTATNGRLTDTLYGWTVGMTRCVYGQKSRAYNFPGVLDTTALQMIVAEGLGSTAIAPITTPLYYTQVNAKLINAQTRKWWVIGTKPSVIVPTIIGSPIFFQGASYSEVLHDAVTNTVYANDVTQVNITCPATTPSATAYIRGTPATGGNPAIPAWIAPGNLTIVEAQVKDLQFQQLWECYIEEIQMLGPQNTTLPVYA
jgi:hypothetical protein